MPPRKAPPVTISNKPDWARDPEIFKRKIQSLPKEIEEHVEGVHRHMLGVKIKAKELADIYKYLDPENPEAIDAYIKRLRAVSDMLMDDLFSRPVDITLKRDGGVIY